MTYPSNILMQISNMRSTRCRGTDVSSIISSDSDFDRTERERKRSESK